MSNKFNDFKKRVYDKSKGKLRLLKDIFARLNLSELENKLLSINTSFISLDTKLKDFPDNYKDQNLPPIPPIPPTPPVPPTPPPYHYEPRPDLNEYGHTYVICHIHNPEGIEIGCLAGSEAYVEFSGIFKYISPYNTSGHGEKLDLLLCLPEPPTCSVICHFNGMTIDAGIYTFLPNTTTTIIFTFSRVNADLIYDFSGSEILEKNFVNTSLPIGFATYGPGEGFGQYYYVLNPSRFDMTIRAVQTEWYMETIAFTLPSTKYPESIIPISIPSQSNFLFWYTQIIKNSDYPNIFLHYSGGNQEIGNLISSALNYTGISFTIPSLIASTYEGPSEVEKSVHGRCSSLKMSSVPYDLLGTGF